MFLETFLAAELRSAWARRAKINHVNFSFKHNQFLNEFAARITVNGSYSLRESDTVVRIDTSFRNVPIAFAVNVDFTDRNPARVPWSSWCRVISRSGLWTKFRKRLRRFADSDGIFYSDLANVRFFHVSAGPDRDFH
ncbi:MAG: hypothetical protein AAGF32_01635 [Pseudomonadota bacterium]